MTLDRSGFVELMNEVAEAWNRGDSATALVRFAPDAHYVEPPDEQRYVGHAELLEFFGADDPPPMSMAWHHLIFDEEEQIGAGEYTFIGERTYHGIVLVRIDADRIADWREYQYPSELDWATFSAGNRF